MAYCTTSDLKLAKATAELVIWAGPEGVTSEPNVAVCAWAIAKADALIDSRLGLRFTVPFTGTVPTIIKNISVDLSICFIAARNLMTFPDDIQKGYDTAIGLLDSIAKGEVGLGVTAVASSLGPSIEATEPYVYNKFNMDMMERDGSDADFQTDSE